MLDKARITLLQPLNALFGQADILRMFKSSAKLSDNTCLPSTKSRHVVANKLVNWSTLSSPRSKFKNEFTTADVCNVSRLASSIQERLMWSPAVSTTAVDKDYAQAV